MAVGSFSIEVRCGRGWFRIAAAAMACVLASLAASGLAAQSVPGTGAQGNLSLAPVSSSENAASRRVRLGGDTRPEVRAENDLGPVEDGLRLEHILLQLKPPPERQAALEAWLDGLGKQSSPNYRHWLSAEEFGERFGVERSDLERVTAWLEDEGATVQGVYPSRMTIDFSATAGQIREAFATELHRYEVDGVRHVANVGDPTVPAELARSIAGIVSLHDFHARSLLEPRLTPAFSTGAQGGVAFPVTASDLATIYNLTPLFKAGYTGKGQTIALIEGSDLYATADWNAFRAAFGLTVYPTGSLRQLHPAGQGNCADPGVVAGWDGEAIVDAEYASAAAPGALIEVVSCKGSAVTDGVMLALVNLVNAPGTPPAALSVSFGTCEAANGAAANAAIAAAYAQAVAEGISVFAAAGDSGAAFCDAGASAATHGIAVNAFASTAYNVAVGGTDFADTFNHQNQTYWQPFNTAQGGSARSYIPEIPWNDSCASPLIAQWNGYGTTYGAAGFCAADWKSEQAYQTTQAGGGGPSGCASGSPGLASTVSGSCHGTAKPSWQTIGGNPKDGVRDIPDVALFAADGVWSHAYIYCDSNMGDANGAPCKAGAVRNWSLGGGTSFAAPIMAGIQALVTQRSGRHGNPNPVYYKLAAAQFSAANLKIACDSDRGVEVASGCVFHDVAQGSADVNCLGPVSCYVDVLSTGSGSYNSAYPAAAGWDFATGLGSVNAYNLVMSTGW